jgi:polyhydroxyalkanoate synthesis regulator phasin
MFQLTPLTVAVASAAGTGFVALIYKIGEKIVDAVIAHKKLTLTDKRQLADEVIKICTEGDSHAYQEAQGSDRHILYIANQLGVFDKQAENDLRLYQSLWALAYGIIQRNTPGDTEFYRELEEKARAVSDRLLLLAKKWKR